MLVGRRLSLQAWRPEFENQASTLKFWAWLHVPVTPVLRERDRHSPELVSVKRCSLGRDPVSTCEPVEHLNHNIKFGTILLSCKDPKPKRVTFLNSVVTRKEAGSQWGSFHRLWTPWLHQVLWLYQIVVPTRQFWEAHGDVCRITLNHVCVVSGSPSLLDPGSRWGF